MTHVKLRMRPPLPVLPRKNTKLMQCRPSKLLVSFHASQTFQRHVSVFLSLRRLHHPPSCMLAFPQPAAFCSAFFAAIFFETSFNSSCVSLSTPSLQLLDTRPNMAQPSLLPSVDDCVFFKIFDVATNNFCVSCLAAKGQHLVSFDHTRKQIRVFIEVRKARSAALLCIFAKSPMVASALALSTAMDCLNAFMVQDFCSQQVLA